MLRGAQTSNFLSETYYDDVTIQLKKHKMVLRL